MTWVDLAVFGLLAVSGLLAFARGFNPDKPPHLNKVTETL